jgi:cell division septum initiation protein DivIVA
MTKQQEIAALDRFIAQLGTASYLGPWLADNREAIVADIKNDLSVSPLLPGAAHKVSAQLLADARTQSTALVEAAREQADALRAQAQRQCDQQRQIVADLIRRHAEEAARALGRL